ncbi:protein FAM151B isoform X1 [Bemisia tabaci]|uniref:protein FAM151B-like isoform X1 n=2 Tax=Bemisia tabaci TaxID=7038 RepID=UPI003B28D808
MDLAQFLVVCILSFSGLSLRSTVHATIEIMEEFFPQIEGNLTKITWAHAVNSKKLLNQTLEGDALMVEGDVILGRHSGDLNMSPMPMMGHPPTTESDLSLKDFLEIVSTAKTPRGIKLDFKSLEVFNASIPVLEEYIYKVTHSIEFVPLWLNADIVSGPINSKTKPVDADFFLKACDEKFPNAVISVGWTTEMSEKNSVGGYTADHINNMTAALSRTRLIVPVTFAVRAGLAAQSRGALVSLIETSVPGTTLTIWMSNENDPVSIPKLRCLMKTVGLNRTFIDVPDKIRQNLDLAHIENATCLPETGPDDGNHAVPVAQSFTLLLIAFALSVFVSM